MIIDGVVVLYNPTNDVLDNVRTYQSFLNRLFVIDNSKNQNNNLVSELKKFSNVEYISFGANLGIAKALKEGMILSLKDNADYTLTMDQDSIFPTDKIDEIKKYLQKYSDYAIVGLNLNSSETEAKLIETKMLITSGSFTKNSDYKLINGYNEDLFIDWVDFDICEQFYRINKKIGYINEISLKHTIGSPIRINVLGKKINAMNHAPIRHYYRYRNALYLYKKDKKFYRNAYYKCCFIDIPLMILFEPLKKAKLKMIKKGRKDARKNILGPYKEEN